jgi:surface antigen
MLTKLRILAPLIIAVSLPYVASVYALSGYPYTGSSLDPWGFYQRQCTSYAAWTQDYNGHTITNTMTGPNGVQGRFGNAGNWDNNASNIGFIVDNQAAVGDVGVLDPYQGGAGSAGHVVYVENVNTDKTVNISEYNWGGTQKYGERDNLTLDHYIHFDECVPPVQQDWTVKSNCLIRADRTFTENLLVKSNSTITITDKGSLNLDLINKSLRVESGSTVLVRNGGKIY